MTNGPLLEVRANGELPGTTFTHGAGKRLTLNLTGTVAGNDRIDRVEVIRNGKVAATLPASELKAGPNGREGSVAFETAVSCNAGGWFLVRALADNSTTFRFASTAPFYVSFTGEPERISRDAAHFFADWLEERIGRIKLQDPARRAEACPTSPRPVRFGKNGWQRLRYADWADHPPRWTRKRSSPFF